MAFTEFENISEFKLGREVTANLLTFPMTAVHLLKASNATTEISEEASRSSGAMVANSSGSSEGP
jgi:hypothetical protein